MRKLNHTMFVGLILSAVVLAMSSALYGIETAKKRVILFSSEDQRLPGMSVIEDAIRSTLNKGSSDRFTFYNEAQDNARIPNEKYEREYVDYLRRKYDGEPIDLIFVRSPPSIRFLLKHQAELFIGVPKIFITNDQRELAGLDLGDEFTGVFGDIDYSPTLDLILKQFPATKKVVVVTGSSSQDAAYLDQAKREFAAYADRVEITYLSGLSMPDLQQAVSSFPVDSACLFISYGRDPDGAGYSIPDAISMLTPLARVPIYAFADSAMGTGVVGGNMLSFELMGTRAGEMGLRVFSGEKPSAIPAQVVESKPIFDWRQVRAWKIDEQALPAGSIVRFREPTLWEEYKPQIIGLSIFTVFQTLMIGWLLILRVRKKNAEKESVKFAVLAAEGHQKLEDVVANVPGIVWESRIDPETGDRQVDFISDHVQEMIGYTPNEISSRPNFWTLVALEEDKDAIEQAFGAIRSGSDLRTQQFRCRKKNGDVIWLEAHLAASRDDRGKVAGIRGVAIDVSEQKRAEETLLYRDMQFTEAQRLSLTGSWEWDPAADTVAWTEELYRIAGIDPSEPAPNFAQQRELYTPESFAKLSSAVEDALKSAKPYELEIEMIRRDGQRVWTYARGEAIRDDELKITKLRGTLQDISAQKKARKELEEALVTVSQLQAQLHEENIYLREEIKLEHNFEEIIGHSSALEYVLFKIEQVAPTDSSVLITGETGTGKELIARAIHVSGKRKSRPIVKVNCAALSATLIESELFGHEKGAFTGAAARKIGRFELADGATLFLDEIGELPVDLQVKLLRVIQEGEFERLGSTKTIKVDVRIIAATNRDLEAEVRKGNFREDLLFRLNVFPINVPPLRERKDDIPELTEFFANRYSKKMGKTIRSVSPSTLRRLRAHSWPGNVRELANVIERSVIYSKSDNLQVLESFGAATASDDRAPSTETLEAIERKYITQVLNETGWKIGGINGAAQVLGLNPSTLRTRMLKLGISKPQGVIDYQVNV